MYLAANHDVGDFGFGVGAVCFVIAGSYGEHKIPRMTLALSNQKTAVLAFLCQQLLGFTARKVTMKPPWRKKKKAGDNKSIYSLSRCF